MTILFPSPMQWSHVEEDFIDHCMNMYLDENNELNIGYTGTVSGIITLWHDHVSACIPMDDARRSLTRPHRPQPCSTLSCSYWSHLPRTQLPEQPLLACPHVQDQCALSGTETQCQCSAAQQDGERVNILQQIANSQEAIGTSCLAYQIPSNRYQRQSGQERYNWCELRSPSEQLHQPAQPRGQHGNSLYSRVPSIRHMCLPLSWQQLCFHISDLLVPHWGSCPCSLVFPWPLGRTLVQKMVPDCSLRSTSAGPLGWSSQSRVGQAGRRSRPIPIHPSAQANAEPADKCLTSKRPQALRTSSTIM